MTETLTARDDTFHKVTDPTHWWTETCWFTFFVPERRLMAYLYAWVRPNLGTTGGGVLVWDDSSELVWEIPFYEYNWHLPFPADADLRDIVFPSGISVRCVEPLQRYRVGFARKGEIDIALEFKGVHDAVRHGSHIDQVGHVTGHMNLRGAEIPIDCFAMRDRSWGPRPDNTGRGVRMGYCYGTASPQEGFLLHTTIENDASDTIEGRFGYLIRDGKRVDLVRGSRRVERDAGRPVRIAIDAVDRGGGQVAITGECVNRVAFTAFPGMFCWLSLTRWDLGGQVAWGENQDVWPPGAWRAYRSGARS